MNAQIKTLPKGEPDGITNPQPEEALDQEVEVIEQGAEEMRFGTGKKLGKDGCGY